MHNGEQRRPAIAIVGSGFSGIGLAIRLNQAGLTNVTIYEKGDRVGGVWRDNTYPGAACYAPSHLYSYSFEPNPNWSRRFAEQPEILAYLRHCAAKYGVLDQVRLRTEIVSAEFNPSTGRWRLTAHDGTTAAADVLVVACGQLSQPSRPAVAGLDFAGPVFHSADWRHDLDLTGRDVAVIGNGASAIQFVPHVAAVARSLTVFQRQAHWISPKPDREYSRFRKAVNWRVALAQRIPRWGSFLWFEAILNPMLISRRGRRLLSWPVRALCRHNLRRVADPELRAALSPDYEVGCKRILQSSDYYEALNRPNTSVVTSPIARVEASAVVTADGRAHPADAIILATGFRSHDFVAPMRVTGLAGQELREYWGSRPRAHLGMTVPGFPNFFLMYGPNTNVGSGSIVHMLESQMTYIAGAAAQLVDGGHLSLRPDMFDRATQARLADTAWNGGGCTSWYLADTAAGPVNTNNWPGSMMSYRRRTRRPDPADYDRYAFRQMTVLSAATGDEPGGVR